MFSSSITETVLSKRKKCCAGKKLPDNQICCPRIKHKAKEEAIEKENPNDNKCCTFNKNIRTPYHDVNMKCEEGIVMNINILICGDKPYNKSRDLCCKSTELYQGKAKAEGWRCCRTSMDVYNIRKNQNYSM